MQRRQDHLQARPDSAALDRARRLRMRQGLLLHPPGPDPMPGFSQAFGLVFVGRRPA